MDKSLLIKVLMICSDQDMRFHFWEFGIILTYIYSTGLYMGSFYAYVLAANEIILLNLATASAKVR